MEHSLNSCLAGIGTELGISLAALAPRGLHEYKGADSLEVAECGANGRGHFGAGRDIYSGREDRVSMSVCACEKLLKRLGAGLQIPPRPASVNTMGRAVDISTPGY